MPVKIDITMDWLEREACEWKLGWDKSYWFTPCQISEADYERLLAFEEEQKWRDQFLAGVLIKRKGEMI